MSTRRSTRRSGGTAMLGRLKSELKQNRHVVGAVRSAYPALNCCAGRRPTICVRRRTSQTRTSMRCASRTGAMTRQRS